MAEILKDLIHERGTIKARLTKFQKYIDYVRNTESNRIDNVLINELQLKLSRIQELFPIFDQCQNKIEKLTEDIDQQSEEREFVEDLFCKLIALAQDLLESYNNKKQKTKRDNESSSSKSSSRKNSCCSHSSNGHNLNVKLPTINLPVFDGNYTKWLEFRDTYESLIHNNESITTISKFHYLRNSLQGGARVVINSLSFSASNYEIAWNMLCERYNNKRILVNNHVKSLFNFEPFTKESHKSMRNMIDYYSKHLRSLEDLKEPVQFWDTLVIYIMSSKLDPATSRHWEEHRNTLDLPPTLADYFEFLRNRADVLETIQYSRMDSSKSDKNINKDTRSTKSFIVNNNSNYKKCIVCNEEHFLYKCDKFKDMSHNNKKELLSKNKICQNCLRYGHHFSKCQFGPCKICKKRHNTLLHIKQNENDTKDTYLANSVATNASAGDSDSSANKRVSLSALVPSQVLLCTAEIDIIDPQTNKTYHAKALLDSGSQSSLLSEKMQKIMKISCTRTKPISIKGVNNTTTNTIKQCDLIIKSKVDEFKFNVSCLVVPEITSKLPSAVVDVTKLNIPVNIKLADTKFFQPSDIHVLLGADVFWELVIPKQIKLGPSKPTLQESHLGWLVAGPIGDMRRPSNIICNFTQEIRNDLAKFWEVDELPSVDKIYTTEEELCEIHYRDNTKRLPDGRFCVKLPLREDPKEALGESYPIAKKRLFGLEKRLNKIQLKDNYNEFLCEYENLGHLREISRPNFGYFIPHHCVIRETSETTKLRVVFNASFKTSSGKSLNDIMFVGPVVQDDLLSILLRFRQNAYVVTADIEKMYRQILVDESQRTLQLILWRSDESQPIRVLQLDTVTYGTGAAPFLSTRCLIELANECSDNEIANAIKHDFYVDDLNTGSNSKEDLKRVVEGVTQKLAEGCFPLRKFRSNVPEIFKDISLIDQSQDFSKDSTVLGLQWSPKSDTLQFSADVVFDSKITKRNILSKACKVFDPLGLLSACTITSKLILQDLWRLKSNWDDEVPKDIKIAWEAFVKGLSHLSLLEIPRCVIQEKITNVEIHCFSDASVKAYAACIYIKTNDTIHLLCAKARVAPLNASMTIPRLELQGALLAARLYSKVMVASKLLVERTVFWSDSTIVLAWLKTSSKTLKTYVYNRVQEIHKLSGESSWRHVPTNLNPADLASRGVAAQQLKNNALWWHGPCYLKKSEHEWPASNPGQTFLELPETKINILVQNIENIIPFEKYSKLYKLQRIFAYVLRFINNCRTKNNLKEKGLLTTNELQNSLVTLAKQSQKDSFPDDINTLSKSKQLNPKSKLLPLNPFVDDKGILRVGGRIQSALHCPYEKIHPILLDSKHSFTKLLFAGEHLKLLHCGPQQLLSSVRDQFWPIGGRNLSTKIVNKCMMCKRLKAQTLQPLMGNLPQPRVNPAPPFETCGTDFAGPFFILNRKGRGAKSSKCYLCIFVCLCTKALHLEVVSDLTSNAFILCLRRFISRRGKPRTIFCDNGKNFVGASNDLSKLLKTCKQDVNEFACSEAIEFKFSPAYSPNFGGIWEAGVKAAKFHIKRVTGNTNLTFEELTTLFVQIEAILNSRPLTAMSTDPSDLSPLTPGHFLIGRPLTALPSPVTQRVSVNRYELIERLRQHFWDRWTKEYLSDLQQRVKWRTVGKNVKIGDLVVIKDEQLPPLNWLLGRVHKLYPGPDGITRVVDLFTKKGIIKRALTKVCALYPDSHEPLENSIFKGGRMLTTVNYPQKG